MLGAQGLYVVSDSGSKVFKFCRFWGFGLRLSGSGFGILGFRTYVSGLNVGVFGLQVWGISFGAGAFAVDKAGHKSKH